MIDIQVTSRRNYEPTGDKSGAQAVSILRFLEGAVEIKDNAPEFLNLLAGNVDEKPDDLLAATGGTTGMEIFTAPQILVPPQDRMTFDPNKNAAPIIDRFRPLMSLKDFTISTTGGGAGVISYRTAKANIVLHDRSRMTEISEILNHNTYSSTRFIVEWGWSHPHGQETAAGINNSYGRFINSLRKREVYSLVKYNMSNDEVGQMNIGLELASTAGKELEMLKISAAPGNAGAPDMARQLYEITDSIRKAIGVLSDTGGLRSGAKSRAIRAFRVLGGAGTFQGMPNLDTEIGNTTFKKLLESLQTELRTMKASSDDSAAQDAAEELAIELGNFYKEDDNDDGAATLENFNEMIANAVNTKIQYCKGGGTSTTKSTADPFLALTENIRDGDAKSEWAPEFYGPSASRSTVSFAKVMAIFVGTPLMQSPIYTDIQLIFHQFNDKAAKLGAKTDGSLSAKNIGEFPIPTRKLGDALTTFFQTRRSHEISVQELIVFIVSTFIDNKAAAPYGLTSLYREKTDPETGRITVERATPYKNYNHGKMTDLLTQTLRNMDVATEFRMPQVACVVETKLLALDEEGAGGNILKIHFIDKAASSAGRISDMLRFAYNKFTSGAEIHAPGISNPERDPLSAIEDKFIEYAMASEGMDVNDLSNLTEKQMALLTETNFPNVVEAISKMPTNINLGATYSAIRTFMPTVDFGSSMSAVSKLNISSEPDNLFATIGMLGGGATPSPLTPTGIGTGDLPLMVYPGRLSMTMMGCPIMEYMQSIFVYLGTGTSYDTVYNVVKVDHKLSPGTYETTIGAGFTDAYGTFRSHQQNLETLAARAQAVLDDGESE